MKLKVFTSFKMFMVIYIVYDVKGVDAVGWVCGMHPVYGPLLFYNVFSKQNAQKLA